MTLATAIKVGVWDLEESADYLKWVMKSKKRRAQSFEDHFMFFDALVDELDSAISLLKALAKEH